MMQYLPFTLLLLGALLLSMSFAHLQHRYYFREVNRLAAQYRKAGYVLSSGLAKGRFRGALAILVMRCEGDIIERAVVMEGASIMARFKEREELRGVPLADLAAQPISKSSLRALRDAGERYHTACERMTETEQAPQPQSGQVQASLPASAG